VALGLFTPHLAPLLTGVTGSAQASAPPNVLILLTDDQGYADLSLSPHSKPGVSTPRLDELLQDGARFTNAHTNGATCAPTRAAIMTGNYQQRHGIYHTPDTRDGLDIDAKLMPTYFKEAGYNTACIGKWHLGLTPEFNPVNRGFDYFYGFLGHGGHDYFNLGPTGARDEAFNGMKRNLEPITDTGYLTTRIGDESVDWIEQNKEDPFFLYVCFNAVHAPAQAPEEDVAKYDTGSERRDTLMAMLDHLDMNIGRIIDALKENDLYDNTLIFVLTDNGGASGMEADNAPLRGAKGQVWEGGHRTFFGVTWKDRIEPGTIVDTPVMSFDILPTSLEAAGIPIPSDKVLDGKSLFPAIEGGVDKLHDYLVWYNGRGPFAIYQDGWKFVRDKAGRRAKGPTDQLYYLPDDGAEETDVIADHPERAEELLNQFMTWKGQMKPFNERQQRFADYAPPPKKTKK
ncbi:MAG: sulfatase-like hydrolase/transferase, partial [Planctomycetota bacterium]